MPQIKDAEEDDRDFIRDIEQTEEMKRSVFTASINLKNESAMMGEGLQETKRDTARQIQTEAKPEKKDRVKKERSDNSFQDKHATSIMTSQAASTVQTRRKQWEKKSSIREERSLPRCIEESGKKAEEKKEKKVEEKKEKEKLKEKKSPAVSKEEFKISPSMTGISQVMAPSTGQLGMITESEVSLFERQSVADL